jgi:hypothetical protein
MLDREQWPMRVFVDYASGGAATPTEEVKRCLAYARQHVV